MDRSVDVTVSTENMENLINNKIQLAMMEALNDDREQLVERVVSAALMQEVEDRYSGRNGKKKTVFGKAIEEMIQASAKDTFQVWLDENQALLRAAIEKRLTKSPQKFINSVADQVMKGFGEAFTVKVTAAWPEEESRY